MNENKSLVIAGHGYIDCLMAAVLTALRECLNRREVEMLMCAQASLADLLRETATGDAVPGRVFIVGVGLSANRGALVDSLQALRHAGCTCTWLSNQEAAQPQQLDGLLEPVLALDAALTDLAAERFAPWGVYEASVRALRDCGDSEALTLFYRTAGFVNRVMPREHGAEVLRLFLDGLRARKLPDFSPALKQYIRAYELMGHRELKGNEPPVYRLKQLIRRVAPADDLRIMILGETGTGKESVANLIHLNSERWTQRFLAYNCASSNSELQESAFRGYCKGAFTGASAYHAGLFEQANGGTLFLDEVGDLSPESQGVLLRILEEKKVMPMGGDKEVPVDVRLITATNKDLWQMADEGTFREDLLYRLQEFTLRTPALREIPGDIPAIADSMWRQLNQGEALPEAAQGPLRSHDWPGNSRELLNFLKFARTMGAGKEEGWSALLEQHCAHRRRLHRGEEKTPVRLDELIALHCRRIVAQCGGNITRAAEMLGIQRPTLRRHLARELTKQPQHP
ncbi:MAG TPA: sigma 54-interacting transcriptional regulator [Candidatus Akkermansia intestinigallinarum]|uniref:Sigma 54-interacting transcriptional regulator n=1 Tax=Candidatus Akkermansia intestinigallinarum TaxID=2838431 RepID=A0A9D1V9W6_9BACT|nr:sigma 54-interacting transcriptional regulator [Candidatus Akkermansia intestinigallinarum]